MIVILLSFSLLKIKKGEQYSTVLHDKFVKKKNPAKLIFGRVFGRISAYHLLYGGGLADDFLLQYLADAVRISPSSGKDSLCSLYWKVAV